MESGCVASRARRPTRPGAGDSMFPLGERGVGGGGSWAAARRRPD
ncbi:MAG TPA: hypothetical protein VIC24_13860 [Gemmatimonadaceae bacterium]